VPVATLTLACCTAEATWSMPMLRAAS